MSSNLFKMNGGVSENKIVYEQVFVRAAEAKYDFI